MPVSRLLLCGVIAALMGCNAPPGSEAGARIAPSGKPVTLLPLEDLLVDANAGTANDASAAALAARAARLRAKAAAN